MHRVAHSHRFPFIAVTVPMFGAAVRSLWLVVLVCTMTSELVPLSLAFEARFSPLTFYFYEGAKLVAFFVFGFLTPISWWGSRSLGKGAIFAIATTAIAELAQAFIPGHRTSVFELLVKLFLLFIGFAFGLDVRHDQRLTAGPLRVRLSSRHWSESL
jgi:hypothetical protein